MKKYFLLLCVVLAVSACGDKVAAVSEAPGQGMTEKERAEAIKKLSEPYKGDIPTVTRKNLNVFPEKK